MTPLSQEFVDNCVVENGFHLRGQEMTRLEVFVDAAFAFAVTMLVISFDSIPSTFEEMVYAIKSIPAFIAAVAQLVWIWYTHNIWSRRFGLDTPYTVFISTTLLIVVLIYVYPMRIMAGGMFSWFSNGYLPSNFSGLTMEQLQDMYIFLSIGFIVLCLVFAQMYRYAIKLREPLRLDAYELHWSQTFVIMWLGAAVIGSLCIALALSLPARWVPLSGFAFSLLGAWFPLAASWRSKRAP